MRYIRLRHPPHLPARWDKVYVGRVTELATMTTHADRSDFFRRRGSWRVLKSWLSKQSSQKCWYCEAKSTRAPFDVDHFRPKSAVTVDRKKLSGENGYYWIAYEWWNFRLSCQRCNRPEDDETGELTGKANEFPVFDEARRCRSPDDAMFEEIPRLLDPCEEADCDLLSHGIDGELKPTALPGTWEFDRARYTIEVLGLNAYGTPEVKRKPWRILDDLIRLAGHQPEVVDHLRRHLSVEHEYSSFFRSAIGSHRDKAWVEALL